MKTKRTDYLMVAFSKLALIDHDEGWKFWFPNELLRLILNLFGKQIVYYIKVLLLWLCTYFGKNIVIYGNLNMRFGENKPLLAITSSSTCLLLQIIYLHLQKKRPQTPFSRVKCPRASPLSSRLKSSDHFFWR